MVCSGRRRSRSCAAAIGSFTEATSGARAFSTSSPPSLRSPPSAGTTGPWAGAVPPTGVLQVGEVFIYVVHDLGDLDLDPVAAGFQVVVSGHSHRPSVMERDGVLYVNPGSSGPRRFKLPITVGELTVVDNAVSARVVELDVGR